MSDWSCSIKRETTTTTTQELKKKKKSLLPLEQQEALQPVIHHLPKTTSTSLSVQTWQ